MTIKIASRSVLCLFNTIPHVILTFNHKIISLLLLCMLISVFPDVLRQSL